MLRGIGGHKFPCFMTATDFNLRLETDAIVFFMIMFALELITKTSIPAGYFGKL
jgi:hypothetical protein